MLRVIVRSGRLRQIESLLLAHPAGLSKAEIARRMGVHRATIGRDIEALSLEVPIVESDDGRLSLNRDDYVTEVRLTIHESLALHLATRLLATRMDRFNPHAAAALRKLGEALRSFSPLVSHHLLMSADVMDSQAQRQDPVYLEVLETLTQAWSQGRKVHVWHRHEGGRVFEYDLAPYFIEPYAVGRTTHVIGWRVPPGAIRTLKLERIQRIALLANEGYEIPEDFDPRRMLADAWGIWYSDDEPVEVVLRFHPRVAHRVRETQWHASEQVREETDGSVVWTAHVAEWREMLPWIRGWGENVEAVAPAVLRDTLVGEAKVMAEVYGWHVSSGRSGDAPSTTLADFFGGEG